jgi:hypothetical protein
VAHVITIVLGIYFWLAESRPNIEIFVSVAVLFVLALGYFGAAKRNPHLNS